MKQQTKKLPTPQEKETACEEITNALERFYNLGIPITITDEGVGFNVPQKQGEINNKF